MVPWSIRRVEDLPSDAKLRKMQFNADGLVQLIGAATPTVPNQAPMPQASKQLLNACVVPPMYIIMWAEWLHHLCLLGGPHMGTKSELAT